VVIPAWNEASTIAAVIAEVRGQNPSLDVAVVDDGSHDGTGTAAVQAGATLIRLPYNLGVGGAMRAGYLFARRNGYSAVVQVDADGQHPADRVEDLLAALAEANVVIGARFAGHGDYRVRGPRRWAMGLLSATLSRVTRTKLTDTTSGFRAADSRAIALFAQHYPAEYLGDTVESLVMASRSGLVVSQVPVEMRPRQGGAPSQSSWKSAVYLGRAALAVVMALLRRKVTLLAPEGEI
jgi:glycosyltransferase involved in cell wall biosynthesis